jgi:hypothetical protein
VFDSYRLSQERSTPALHEVWKTLHAFEGGGFSPLESEMMRRVMGWRFHFVVGGALSLSRTYRGSSVALLFAVGSSVG